MERIVGWMKVHDPVTGMDFTLYDTSKDCEFKVADIGRGGAVLLRESQNVIFRFSENSVGWEPVPEEWGLAGHYVSYSYRAQNPGKRPRGVIVTDVRSALGTEGCTVIHYYCKHSPTEAHEAELMALARRYIEVERKPSLTEIGYTPTFLVRIVTDTDEVLSESEELTRMVNEAVRPSRARDLPILLTGGFSHDEVMAIAALHLSHPMQVPTFYTPKRLPQVSYPTPRQNKRKIYR